MPVGRLREIWQQITVHLSAVLNSLRLVQSEFMYVFYANMQVHVVTYDGLIRLLIQIPLREMQSTHAVYKVIPLTTYSIELGIHIQIGYTDKLFAVSTDRRTYYELGPGYRSNCKVGHVNFCKISSPRVDRSYDSMPKWIILR